MCLAVITSGIGYADESSKDDFLEKIFQGSVPTPNYIWLTPAVRQRMESILIHDYKGLRIKYWRENEQAVWILDDVVKGKPVSAGIVVSQGKIKMVEILSAQGRWGSLVKNENFTAQFENAASDENNRLTQSIDGISGATISVNTVSRLAQLALALDSFQKMK